MIVPVTSNRTRPKEALTLVQGPEKMVKTYSAFEQLPAAYLRLFEEGAAQSIFCSLPWFQNLARTTLDERDRLQIYGVELADGTGTPIAALVTRHRERQGKRLSAMKLSSLSNYYTSLYEPVLASGYDPQASLGELAQAICAKTPRWDVVELSPLDRDSPGFAGLVHSLKQAGMVVQTYFCFGNWYYALNGRSYGEYLESLRSSVRNIARSKNKKLERSGRVRVEIFRSSPGLESAVQEYEQVYAASWKVPEPYPTFVPGLIRTCADRGWLCLGLAYVDGYPAAAQVWIVCGGTASIYKIAYDQRFAQLSVGTYLMTRLMEYVIEVDKVQEVDYLSGDDRYKRDWMSQRRERWGILALNPRTPMGMLAIARHVGGRAVKTAVQGILRRSARPRTNSPQAEESPSRSHEKEQIEQARAQDKQ